FSQAVSNYPVCSPFRAMLMTGKYPHSNGVLANCNTNGAKHGYELQEKEICWSDILKEKGYSLGYIGKWHLDSPYLPYVECYNNRDDFAWNEWCPPTRRHGFDFWYAYGTYDQHMNPMYWDTAAARDGAQWVEQWGPEHEADQAVRYLRNQAGTLRDPDKPFALVVSMNPPHMPYDQLPERYLAGYEDHTLEMLCRHPNIPPAGTRWGDYYRRHIRNYLAMTTGVDEQFGRILTELKAQGLEEDTIVFFTSDHGNCLGIHDQISKNNHYEESMRVPFMLRWPGRIQPRQDDLLFSSPDIYPSLLNLMGFAEDIPQGVEGRSFADLILNDRGDRPASQLYLWMAYGQPGWGRRGVRTRRHTLMLSRIPDQPDEVVLHDNQIDPFQLKNIAESSPDIVSLLQRQELIPWLEQTNDPWLQNL
ncbi:MAG: sulfatase-like hydrolase/transferase, partial [Candidatus Aminicenantes bacterium]|nr:sulfatase-like hydrolase/transferase [Candidatus Aminicenantes bacterium]